MPIGIIYSTTPTPLSALWREVWWSQWGRLLDSEVRRWRGVLWPFVQSLWRLLSPPFRMSWMCCTIKLMATARNRGGYTEYLENTPIKLLDSQRKVTKYQNWLSRTSYIFFLVCTLSFHVKNGTCITHNATHISPFRDFGVFCRFVLIKLLVFTPSWQFWLYLAPSAATKDFMQLSSHTQYYCPATVNRLMCKISWFTFEQNGPRETIPRLTNTNAISAYCMTTALTKVVCSTGNNHICILLCLVEI